ncbi:MAG: glutaredoxin family protein [Methylophagaceae bacterium]
MKKLLIIALLSYGAYNYFVKSASLNSFDSAGNPITILFTINNCPPCDEARRYLNKRKIDFQEYNINEDGNDAKSKLRQAGGGRSFPYLMSGDQSIAIYSKAMYTGFFAELFGSDFLSPLERRLLKKNFDSQGRPKLVMYSTTTCGYCTRAREYFESKNIAFTELYIDSDLTAKQHYDSLEGSGTPLIYIGYSRIDGFDKRRLKSLIKDKLI